MARRKTNRNKADVAGKVKVVKKRRNFRSSDRNRASPAPIIILYNDLSPTHVIVAMGQESFLDIKCMELHNPVIYWFAQCYQPKRCAFVVPHRGVIPLTEKCVHLMIGLSRGQVEVRYYTDYELEDEI